LIDLKELWIGDLIKIISTGKVGKFEGVNDNGDARIKIKNEFLSVRASDLIIYLEKEKEPIIKFEESTTARKIELEDIFDLHIEVLNPNLIDSLPERILDFQVKAFTAYLNAAKKSYKSEFTVIHGKGEGILKNYITSIIKNDKDVKLYDSINDGGAIRFVL